MDLVFLLYVPLKAEVFRVVLTGTRKNRPTMSDLFDAAAEIINSRVAFSKRFWPRNAEDAVNVLRSCIMKRGFTE